MHDGRITLTQFNIEEQRRNPQATGDFSGVLNDIATACKSIGNAVNRGALTGDGPSGQRRARPLAEIAHEVMLRSNEWGGRLAGMASEEMADISSIPAGYPRGRYLLVFDPLNGSGNLDINFMVGTIFSILRAPDNGREAQLEDFLQPGTEQAGAGFALYGASTRLVLTTGNGVNGFTLDRDIGEFVLTHPNMTIPAEAATFAINASNERFWEAPVKRYVDECLAGKTGPRGKDFGMRWVASLIAETYRILIRGGVFLYPVDDKTRDQGGRLGLLYEANPISFIVEQAGGASTTGRQRLMEVRPAELHQRAPFIFGSRSEVERIDRYHADWASGKDSERFESPLFSTRSLFRQQ